MAFKTACLLFTLAVVCYGLPQHGDFVPDPGFSDGHGHGGIPHHGDGGFPGGFVPDPGFSDGHGHGGVATQGDGGYPGGFVPDPGFSDGHGHGGVETVGHGIEY